MELKNVNKVLKNSLNFLDNQYVYSVLVIILVLYNSLLFTNINNFIGNMYNFGIVRVLILLLILCVSQKSCLLGILLAVSYVLSVSMSSNEYFQDMMGSETEELPPSPADGSEPAPVTNSTETFLPNMAVNSESIEEPTNPDPRVLNQDVDVVKKNVMSNNLSTVNCLNNYTPDNLGVGNVCRPMDTYKGEYNTQGLNYPIGYDSDVINGGSKLHQR